ncbi:MAG: hypothetical protein MJA83_14070 [Gammaproteobacteria bacterium]|nr:hypothetical protein [Gammaproteobacteria bacterium]
MQKIVRTLSIVIISVIHVPGFADDLTIPNVFTAGTPAVASEVNANFTAVETEVDDHAARIAQLEATIATLQATIATLQASSVDDLSTYVTVSIDNQGNPAVFVTGANLHVRDGTGTTATNPPNGLGNLIVGYDEARAVASNKSGSHNLIVGSQHNYTLFSGVAFGLQNTVSGEYATATGGEQNVASGNQASISSGFANTASGLHASVSGGSNNSAESNSSSVSGGVFNRAIAGNSSVSGGRGNRASGVESSVSGGFENLAQGDLSSVSAGSLSEARGAVSSISGGVANLAIGDTSSISGGDGVINNSTNASVLAEGAFQNAGD